MLFFIIVVISSQKQDVQSHRMAIKKGQKSATVHAVLPQSGSRGEWWRYWGAVWGVLQKTPVQSPVGQLGMQGPCQADSLETE